MTSTTPPISGLPQDPQPTAPPQQPVAPIASPLAAPPAAPQEPQPDFIEQFRQLGQQKTEQQASLLLARLRATIETDPKLAAEARSYGLQFGTNFRWTVENLESMRQLARYREQQALVAGSLSQAQMALLERERDAAVARDEIANLGYLERLTQTARAGYVATELGLLDNMVAQGVPLTPEQETQRSALADELKKLPQDDAEMGMGMPLYGLARYAGQFRVQFRESAEEATIGAGTGALAGSILPGPGTLVGTKVGLGLGFATGMLTTTKRSETGAAYRSYREMGYDHESSAAAASAYGWTATGIEAIGTVASFARPLTAPVMGALKRQVMNAAMDAVARPTRSKIITDAVINTALGVAGEGGEEAAQQYFEIVGQQWAQENMRQRGLGDQAPATDFEKGTAWGKIGDAALVGAATWLIPSAGTSAYRMHWDAKRARQAADSKDTLSSVNAAAAQQKLRTDAPDLLREFLATATRGTDSETVYFDARRLVEAVQRLQEQQDKQSRLDGTPRAPIADQLERAAPGLLGRARTAVGDVTIPLADFGANLAGTPLGDELLQHGTLDPEVASPSEAAIAREQAGAQWRGAKAEQMRAEADKLAAEDNAVAESRQRVKDDYLPVLMEGAGYTRREANTVVEMVAAYVTTAAKRMGMLPHEFVAKYPLPFTRRMDEAPASVQGEMGAQQQASAATVPDQEQQVTSEFFQRPGRFYRVIVGDAAFQDIVDSGQVRTNANQKLRENMTMAEKLAARPTAFPSFSKDAAGMSYAADNPQHYIVVTSDQSIQPSKAGRHGPGTTHFPTDAAGKHLESLPADKVRVYQHTGNGQYRLVYDQGKQVTQAEAQPAAAQEVAPAPPPEAGVFDPANPPAPSDASGRGPVVVAVMAYDGKVYYDRSATMHGDLTDTFPDIADEIIDAGFIRDGKYRMGMSDGGYSVFESDDPEMVARVRGFADKLNSQADELRSRGAMGQPSSLPTQGEGGTLGQSDGRPSETRGDSADSAPAGELPDGRGLPGSPVAVDVPTGPQPGAPLAGLPTDFVVAGRSVTAGPSEVARKIARDYAASRGMLYSPPVVFAPLDEDRARRIAQAFDAMQHQPNDPEVAAAYRALAEETVAQYEAMLKSGITVLFNPVGVESYQTPREALLDISENNRLYVFSTEDGYGQTGISDQERAENPMLADSGFKFGDRPALINDLFRAIHDYFGHYKEGVGFRARGEENAWQQHMAMYSPLARKAATTELRGQNSWVNFGPFAEQNATASGGNTTYAPQKIGLLPDWAVTEGWLGGPRSQGGELRSRNAMQGPIGPGGGAVPASIPKWGVAKTGLRLSPKQVKASASASPSASMARKNYAKIDAVFDAVPNPLASEKDWHKFMALLTGQATVIGAPKQALRYAADPQLIADYLKAMRPDQLASRREGFALGARVQAAYRDGTATPSTTGRLLAWGMLSRSAGAFPHEGAYMDLVHNGIDKWIDLAVQKEWTDQDVDDYLAWSQPLMESLKGGVSPGVGVTSNANDIGRYLLRKLSKKDAEGKSGLLRLHELFSGTATTDVIRREFFALGDGLGIQNKVLSFVLLVAGRTDTLVLDRVQITHLWGREYQDAAAAAGLKRNKNGGVNVYDPSAGAHGPGGLQPVGDGHLGMAIYEALARGLTDAVREGYRLAGMEGFGDGTLGAFHWDSWLVESSQAIAHPTIEALIGMPRPDLGVRQGKFDTWHYGTVYRSDGLYSVGLLQSAERVLMTHTQYRQFIDEISEEKQFGKPGSVAPKGFKVSSNKNRPWVDATGISKQAYDDKARSFRRPDPEAGEAAAADGAGSVRPVQADRRRDRGGAPKEEGRQGGEAAAGQVGPELRSRSSAAAANQTPVPAVEADERDKLDSVEGVAGVERFPVSTRLVRTGKRQLGAAKIGDEADLAQAMAPSMQRFAVEHLDFVVTDKAGTPLAVVGGFKGSFNAAAIELSTVVNEVSRVRGAAYLWIVHNHPSGEPTLSQPDMAVARTIDRLFSGSGIESRGIMAIGSTGKYEWSLGDRDVKSGEASTAARGKTVPVMEREIARNDAVQSMTLTNPTDMHKAGKDLLGTDRPGVLFLDNKLRVAGFIEIDSNASRLRNTPTMGMLYRAGSAANAVHFVLVNVDKFRDGALAAANIATFFESHGVRMVDAFESTSSSSAKSKVQPLTRGFGQFFSRDRRTLGSFSPSANRITLYRGNNRSTWLHEFGHYWLEVTTAIVSEGNAPAEVVDDLGVMLNWLGIQATATQSAVDVWRGMDLEARRKYHERFAYHFEIFLGRGEAPSPELHGVFERIGAWIRDVYRGLLEQTRRLGDMFREEFGEDLGVLSPEARRVMERIFAADEDIERAAVEREVRTMFQTREEALAAGMSEAAWDELQAEVWLSKERAKDELLEATERSGKSTIARANREIGEMEREQREARQGISAEVEQEVAGERVERARLWLRRGQVRNSDGTITQTPEWQKLDRDTVKAMLGIGTDKPKVSEEQFAKLRGMLVDGGQQPDELASMVGYDSGEQLVTDLIEQPTAKEMVDVRTEARMRREHPEFFDSTSRRSRIERAIANDMRRRVLATELLHLQRAVLTSPTLGRLADAASEAFDEANRLEDEQRRLREQAREIDVLAVDDENYAAARDALRTQANKLTDQINGLRRQESGEQTVRTIMAAVRLAAASNVSMRTVREMSPRGLNAAAARMARETMQALKAGEFLRAVDLKRRQLVLTEMARQAADFQDELRIGRNLFRRFAKDDEVLARTHTMPLIYLGRAVLAGHGLRDPNRDAPTGRDPMQPTHFAEALRMVREMNESLAAELERDVLPSMMRSATGDFRDLTVEEWRSLRDNMEMLWERSRAERTALVDGRREAIEWVEEQLLAAPGMTSPTRPAVGVEGGGTTWDKVVHELLAGKAARKRVEHWAIQMDGGTPGMWHKAVFRRLADAETRAEQLERTFVTRVTRVLQRLVPMLRSEPIVWQVDSRRTYTFGQRGAVVTGRNGPAMAELFMAVMHAQGNLSNKEKLLLDPRREWGTQAIDPLTGERTLDSSAWDSFFADKVRDGTITKEFLDAAQEIGDVFEEMRPLLQAAHVEAFGYPFEVVEPLPFTVVWPDGTTSSYRGWYMPAKADRMLVQDADLQVEDMLTEARTSLAQTPRGMTMSRDPNTFRALSLQLSLLPGHVRESVRFAAMGPAIVDVQRLLNRRDIKRRLDAINPQLRPRMLAPWVKNAAMLTTSLRDESDTPTQSRLMRRLDRLFTYVTMMSNVANAAQNPLQLIPAATVLIGDHGSSRALGAMLSAAAHYSRNPRRVGRVVRSMSSFMDGRGNNEVRDAVTRVQQMLRVDGNVVERAANLRDDYERYLLDATYVLQSMTQHVGDQIAWKAAYSLEVQRHDDPEVAERLAVAYADSVVRRTQGSLRATDRSASEVTTPMKALLTKFSGFFVQMYNLMSGMMGAVRQESGSGNRRLKYLGIYLGVWGLPFALAALLMKAMQGALDDDEDKDGEWWDDLAWDILVESQVRPFAPLFGVGGRSAEAIVNIVDGSPETIGRMPSPAPFALLERGAKAALRAMGGKRNNVTGGDIVTLLTLIGLPVPMPKQAGYAIDAMSGQVEPTVRGAITGRAAKDERRR